MILSGTARWLLRLAAAAVLTFVYAPLLLVLLNSFSTSVTFAWPPPAYTLRWWQAAATNEGVRTAVVTSVEVAVCAALIAVVLGTLASMALVRYRFFGRDTVSFLVLLPIALPGIVTGIALNNAFRVLGIGLGLLTVVIGHATFCIVLVYNNALARLRRMGSSLEEASMDLGAGVWQTFRLVTFPQLRSALFAGGLLAFALSFDEIIVTTFTAPPGVQTLPLWIFSNLFRPNQAPVVNVVAAALIVLSVIPVWLAQRVS
ncbi:MAG: putative spermidine/putrescine transport system permease protein, partial [Pseudonocardiales bacterium]|nr:putative spermidine/putrescine transport system permease protein [Pseudonocardiales bacterium]